MNQYRQGDEVYWQGGGDTKAGLAVIRAVLTWPVD